MSDKPSNSDHQVPFQCMVMWELETGKKAFVGSKLVFPTKYLFLEFLNKEYTLKTMDAFAENVRNVNQDAKNFNVMTVCIIATSTTDTQDMKITHALKGCSDA